MQKSILTTRKWKGHALNSLASENKFIIWETKFYDIYDQSNAKITCRSNLYSRDLFVLLSGQVFTKSQN